MVFVVVTPCIHIMEEAAKYILRTRGLLVTQPHNHPLPLPLLDGGTPPV